MSFIKKNPKNIVFTIIVILLALVPLFCDLGIMKSSSVVRYGRYITFAIVAIGLDMIWGYTGILSLGHGIYFCLGGYGMAMYLLMQKTGGKVTDFMQRGGFTDLPWFWKPFLNLPLSLILIVVIPSLLAMLIGYFTFKNRVRGVYFSIISQALTWAMYTLFNGLQPYTNGTNGITGIDTIIGSYYDQGNIKILFYASLVTLVLVYALSAFLLSTKFGKILIAIRDGENRTYFSGYCVSKFKTFVYVLSALFAAVAGALYVNLNNSISTTEMTITFSVTMVIWVAVGGRGSLIGAVIGALLVSSCEFSVSSALPDLWQYIIGIFFTIVILFFRKGIVGFVSDIFAKLTSKKLDTVKKGSAANV